MAESLMREHNLAGWQFSFMRAKRKMGCANFARQTISLSSALVELNNDEVIKDTILHEIAHVLVGAKHGHDYVWRMQAISIGCDGKSGYGSEVITPRKTYRGTCTTCGKNVYRFRRTVLACGQCCKGTYNSKYVFVWTRNTKEVTVKQIMSS